MEHGCASHCIKRNCQQIGKVVFRKLVREAVFVSKIVWNIGMIWKIYDSICIQLYQKTYCMVLYRNTR